MSLTIGYWPYGYIHPRTTCGPMYSPTAKIRLPDRYVGAGSINYCDSKAIQCDEFGRAALETLRESYHTMPTGSVREFARVFSAQNFEYLASEIKKQSGHDIDKSELFDAMIQAFTLIAPRTDIMDVDRRLNFSDDVTRSYVEEVNKQVLDRTVEETKQANRLWDFYAKNRNGPSEMPDNCDIDTRTRLVGSFYAADYWMPDC